MEVRVPESCKIVSLTSMVCETINILPVVGDNPRCIRSRFFLDRLCIMSSKTLSLGVVSCRESKTHKTSKGCWRESRVVIVFLDGLTEPNESIHRYTSLSTQVRTKNEKLEELLSIWHRSSVGRARHFDWFVLFITKFMEKNIIKKECILSERRKRQLMLSGCRIHPNKRKPRLWWHRLWRRLSKAQKCVNGVETI